MKILFLNAYGDLRGGSQRTTAIIADTLSDRGHTVYFACPGGAFSEQLIASGHHHLDLPRTDWLDGKLHQAGAENFVRLSSYCREHGIQIVHSFQYGSHLLGRLVSDLTDCAPVHTVLGPLSPGQRFGPGLMTAICEEFKEAAIAVGAAQVEVIRERIDLEMFQPQEACKEATVAFVSRLDGPLRERAEFFLEAIGLVKTPARFIVVGDGEHLEELSRDTRAEFHGHVNDVVPVYAQSQIVIGAGNTLLEAMACQRPGICLGQVGFADIATPETIEDMSQFNLSGRHAAQKKDNSPLHLATAIDELLEDATRRATLGTWGHQWVSEHYDVVACAPRLEAVYERAIQERATQAPLPRLSHSASLIGGMLTNKLFKTLKRYLLVMLALLSACTAGGPRTPLRTAALYPTLTPNSQCRLAETRTLPQRGQVFVLDIDGTKTVRRIAGLPGDRVEITDGELNLNGQRLVTSSTRKTQRCLAGISVRCLCTIHEERLGGRTYPVQLLRRSGLRDDARCQPGLDGLSVTVPPGHVYVLADNRDGALDSRTLGPIPIENLSKRALSCKPSP